MSEIEEKTPRYVFSGKTEDYLTWSKKYMARATMKKFAGIIRYSFSFLLTICSPDSVDYSDTLRLQQINLNLLISLLDSLLRGI